MELKIVECATCYMPFGISKTTKDRLRKCHNSFYCPSGHANYFHGETREEKLRKQLEDRKADVDRLVQEKYELQKRIVDANKKPARKPRKPKSK